MKEMKSEELAWRIRRDTINMVHAAHASHIGSVLSCADIIAVLYANVARYDADEPEWDGRDRVILSKGHSGAAIYAVLAECGFFPVNDLKSYGQNGSKFSCHVAHKGVAGVEISTGSLGHGASVACGMALNAKRRGKDYRVFSIVGDGECNEGSIWEMAMLSAQNELDNFTIVIDQNGMQAMGFTNQIINMEPMADKWKAFGWHVTEVADGSDHEMLRSAFAEDNKGKPKVIIAKTMKGKGVSFMENELIWHYRDPQGEFYERALQEIEKVGFKN